jgi:hypothetical protein
VSREHGCDGDEAQRRTRILGAYDFAGCLIVPERVRIESRKNEQNVAGISRAIVRHTRETSWEGGRIPAGDRYGQRATCVWCEPGESSNSAELVHIV